VRLHRLTFRGIGPFADEHTIDFDAFEQAGLFLLEGPTGSGKSTVVDAIVFALYGEPAAKGSSADRLRSDYIVDSVEAFVELTFSTERATYRVRRTPAYFRTSRSGNEARVNSKATLVRLLTPNSADGDAVATGPREVALAINKAIGLNREQFTQTVVLPQGEFHEFLRSEPKKRQELVQRLFGAEVFERVQQLLEKKRREAEDQRRTARTAITSAAGAFVGAAALTDDERVELEVLQANTVALLERTDSVVAAWRAAVEAAASAELAASTALTQAQVELAAAQQAAQLRAEVLDLIRRQDALDLRAAATEAVRVELAAAERAAQVMASLQSLDDAVNAESAASAERAELVAALDPIDAANDSTTWPQRLIELRAEVTTLGPIVELEARSAEHANAIEVLERDLEQQLDQERTYRERVANAPQQRAELEARLTQARTVAAAEAVVAERLTLLEGRVKEAAELATIEPLRHAATTALAAALAATNAAEERAGQLRQRWLEGMAAELALTLTSDEPCPVCGSREHPTPATPAADHVTHERVATAETQVQDARAEVERVRTAKVELDLRVTTLEAALGSDPSEIAEQLAQTAAQLHETQLASELVRVTEAELAHVASAEAAARAALTELAGRIGRLAADLEAKQSAQRDAAATVATQSAGYASVAARVAALERRVTSLDTALAAHSAVESARLVTTTREAAVTDALRAAAFDSSDAARQAARPDAQRVEARALLDAYDAERIEVAAALASDRLADVDVSTEVDVAAPQAAFAAAKVAHDAAVAERATASDTATRAQLAHDSLGAAIADAGGVHEQTAATIRLANLVSASTNENKLLMPLVAFVLRERFERVIDAANDRLRSLSDGRFTLVRTEERDGLQRTGLGLTVLDLETGRTREPASLSGGETFYTALALALGLSDVVVGGSGGIQLGTLFIDEGFGSLDPDRLEDVLEVLRRLQSSGRVIGVISHVAEMKEAIPARIEVRRSADGGSTLQVRV